MGFGPKTQHFAMVVWASFGPRQSVSILDCGFSVQLGGFFGPYGVRSLTLV